MNREGEANVLVIGAAAAGAASPAPAPLGNQGRIVLRAFEKQGWEYWPTEQAIATRPYDGRAACDFRSFCPFGCPPGALSSADVTYWPKALKNGVELCTNARVREISLHPNGRARGAIYYDADGHAGEDRARLVLVSSHETLARYLNHEVVVFDHRAHDVSNLFIVDGSSFTTSAGVNPTSTIQALALRCADRIWQWRRDWQ